MDSSPPRESGSFDPKKHVFPSSKSLGSIVDGSTTQAPPPSTSALVVSRPQKPMDLPSPCNPKAFDPKNPLFPSSKTQNDFAPPSPKSASPPSSDSLVDFPALPPTSKSLVVIGSLPIPAPPPPKPLRTAPTALALQTQPNAVSAELQQPVASFVPSTNLHQAPISHRLVPASNVSKKLVTSKVFDAYSGNFEFNPCYQINGHSSNVCKRMEVGVLKEKIDGKIKESIDGGNATVLEEGEVGNITDEAKIDLAKQNSATFAVEEPSLEPHNFLCGNNGGNTKGVLKTRVDNLQIGCSFEPLAAVGKEDFAVENCVLQGISANCVEEATLAKDISLIVQDKEVQTTSNEIQAGIITISEKIRANSSMVCSEIDLEKRVRQISAADSVKEATLIEDFSQLKKNGSGFPSSTGRQVDILQVAEKIKAKAPVNCSENRFEVGDVLQSAADSVEAATLIEDISKLKQGGNDIPKGVQRPVSFLQVTERIRAKSIVGCPENSFEVRALLQSAADPNDKPTLRGHISASRDTKAIILGSIESSFTGLQNDVSLSSIAAVVEEISSDEDGGTQCAVQNSNEHISCSGGDTDRILGPTVSQEAHLQVQGEEKDMTKHATEKWKHKVLSPALRAEMDEIVDLILKSGFKPP